MYLLQLLLTSPALARDCFLSGRRDPRCQYCTMGSFKPGGPAGDTGLQASAVVCIPTSNCSGASSARLCAAWRVRTALDPHQCPVGYDSVNYHPNSMLGWSRSVKNQLSSSHSRSYSETLTDQSLRSAVLLNSNTSIIRTAILHLVLFCAAHTMILPVTPYLLAHVVRD